MQSEQEGLECKCSIISRRRRVPKLHVDILGEWIWYNSHLKIPFFKGDRFSPPQHLNLF